MKQINNTIEKSFTKRLNGTELSQELIQKIDHRLTSELTLSNWPRPSIF